MIEINWFANEERIMSRTRSAGEERQAEEVAAGGVRVDKCIGCEGIWLDKVELEIIRNKENGFMENLLSVFRQ